MNPEKKASEMLETLLLVFGGILTSHGLLKFIPTDINPIWMIVGGVFITAYGAQLIRGRLS